jgi:hypothetical protein
MTETQWNAVSSFRTRFKEQLTKWTNEIETKNLKELLLTIQKEGAKKDGVPPYSLDNFLVYNKALDDITKEDRISLIVIGDNPGKEEQLNKNCRYLVGQSGKIAEGFFKRNPELNTDFRKNVIILNKTPLHTAKTKELSLIKKYNSPILDTIFLESQIWMATNTALLHEELCKEHSGSCQLWLVGYGELKERGLFLPYKEALQDFYTEKKTVKEQVFVYQHFSMNRFLIDLNTHSDPKNSLKENLEKLGKSHRLEILGW